MSNEAVVSFIHNRLQITDNLEDICNQVIDTCLHKVVSFHRFKLLIEILH